MAITLLQSATGYTVGTTLSVSLPTGTTTGRVIITIENDSSSSSVGLTSSPSGGGATWVSYNPYGTLNWSSGNFSVPQIYEGYNVTNGTTTFTFNMNADSPYGTSVTIMEFSGLASSTSSAMDVKNGTFGPNTPNLTPTQPNELWIAQLIVDGPGINGSLSSPSNGFTAVTTTAVYNNQQYATAYYASSDSAAHSTGWTNSGSLLTTNSVAAIIAFKSANPGTFYIDAYANASSSPNATGYNGTITSSTLTTSNANDVIVVYIAWEYPSNQSGTIASVTATGLTFQRRSSYYNSGMSNGGTQSQEIWWAIATSTFTGTITATFSSAAVDDAVMQVLAVQGPNTTAPWDANSSFPAKLAYNTGSGTISTNTSSTMILGFWGTPGYSNSTAPYPTTPTAGFATYQSVSNTGAQWFEYGYTGYGIASSVQTSAIWGWNSWSDNYGFPAGNSSYTILDALTSINQTSTVNSNFLAFC